MSRNGLTFLGKRLMMSSTVLAKQLNSIMHAFILRYHASATLRAREAQQFVPLLDGRPSRQGYLNPKEHKTAEVNTNVSL